MLPLLLVLLAQSPVADPAGPIFSSPSLRQLAFFEFAPASGAGMGSACPLPNWALQSEAIDNASWTKNSSGVAVPTVTADQAANPLTGAVTADRVQVPALTSPGQYSRVYTTITGIPSGSAYCYVWTKGNGMSGSFPMYFNTAFPAQTATCSFTDGVWSLCSQTGTVTTAAEFWYLGASGTGSFSQPALDFFLSGAQCNVGSTQSAYIPTTTAAKGQTITGAKGEALTFTRASTSICTKTASGGLATTGIANGDLVVMPSNQPRVEYDGAGTLGLLVEAAGTNLWLQTQAFNNVAWTKTGITDAAPTVTADFAVAPDGTTTAERVQFAATTGAANDSSVEQFVSTAAGQLSVSLYVKGNGTSGTIDICSFATSWACTPCNYASATWTRCTLDNRAAGAASNYIQFGNVSYHNGGTLRSAADVLVWQAQGQLNSYTTSPIPTTTIAEIRAKEIAGVTSAQFAGGTLPSGTYSKAITVMVPWTLATEPPLPSLIIGEKSGFTGSDMFLASGGLRIQNGTGAAFVNITTGVITVTYPMRIGVSSFGGQVNAYVNGALFGASPYALADSVAPTGPMVGIGDDSFGVSALDGIWSRLCWDGPAVRCR